MEAAIVTNLYLGMKMFNVVSIDQLVHAQNSNHVGPIMLQLSENPLMIGLGFTNISACIWTHVSCHRGLNYRIHRVITRANLQVPKYSKGARGGNVLTSDWQLSDFSNIIQFQFSLIFLGIEEPPVPVLSKRLEELGAFKK
jgi:hypothetical protein